MDSSSSSDTEDLPIDNEAKNNRRLRSTINVLRRALVDADSKMRSMTLFAQNRENVVKALQNEVAELKSDLLSIRYDLEVARQTIKILESKLSS